MLRLFEIWLDEFLFYLWYLIDVCFVPIFNINDGFIFFFTVETEDFNDRFVLFLAKTGNFLGNPFIMWSLISVLPLAWFIQFLFLVFLTCLLYNLLLKCFLYYHFVLLLTFLFFLIRIVFFLIQCVQLIVSKLLFLCCFFTFFLVDIYFFFWNYW